MIKYNLTFIDFALSEQSAIHKFFFARVIATYNDLSYDHGKNGVAKVFISAYLGT